MVDAPVSMPSRKHYIN